MLEYSWDDRKTILYRLDFKVIQKQSRERKVIVIFNKFK